MSKVLSDRTWRGGDNIFFILLDGRVARPCAVQYGYIDLRSAQQAQPLHPPRAAKLPRRSKPPRPPCLPKLCRDVAQDACPLMFASRHLIEATINESQLSEIPRIQETMHRIHVFTDNTVRVSHQVTRSGSCLCPWCGQTNLSVRKSNCSQKHAAGYRSMCCVIAYESVVM